MYLVNSYVHLFNGKYNNNANKLLPNVALLHSEKDNSNKYAVTLHSSHQITALECKNLEKKTSSELIKIITSNEVWIRKEHCSANIN